MNIEKLKALAKNTPLADPNRAALVWAAGEIERRDAAIKGIMPYLRRDFDNKFLPRDHRAAIEELVAVRKEGE